MPGFLLLVPTMAWGSGFVYLLQALLVGAVAFVVILLFSSHMRFERMRALLNDAGGGDLTPLDVFTMKLADRLGCGFHQPAPFVVAFIEAASADETLNLADRLRGRVRAADTAQACGPGRCGLVLEARRNTAERIARRLAEAGPAGGGPGCEVHLGIVTVPENGTASAALVALAVTSAREARAGQRAFVLAGTAGRDGADEAAATVDARVTPRDKVVKAPVDVAGIHGPEKVMNALQKFVAARRRDDAPVALLCLGLERADRGEQPGGAEGVPALLGGVTALADNHLRAGDLIGWLGNDKLVIGLASTCEAAGRVAMRLGGVVRDTAFEVGTARRLKTRVVVGIAACPEHGSTPRELVKAADTALAVARRERVGQRVYDASMKDREAPKERVVDVL